MWWQFRPCANFNDNKQKSIGHQKGAGLQRSKENECLLTTKESCRWWESSFGEGGQLSRQLGGSIIVENLGRQTERI